MQSLGFKSRYPSMILATRSGKNPAQSGHYPDCCVRLVMNGGISGNDGNGIEVSQIAKLM